MDRQAWIERIAQTMLDNLAAGVHRPEEVTEPVDLGPPLPLPQLNPDGTRKA